ncbi:MAG: rRNA maturation RNase YbeY [Alphaproteobacteria bacterium]
MKNIKQEELPVPSWVSVDQESPLWNDHLEDSCQTLTEASQVFLQEFPLYRGKIEVSVLLTDDLHIQALNREYREKDQPTNVLSFPLEDLQKGTFLPKVPHILLGDMVFAFETILKESKAEEISFQDHLFHLCIHSFLHLLGFDHEADEDAEEMEALEIKMLKSVGIEMRKY